MSSIEYYDMFCESQHDKSLYKMYVYDVVNSRHIEEKFHYKNFILISYVMKEISIVEKARNIKILYDGNDLIHRDVYKKLPDDISNILMDNNYKIKENPLIKTASRADMIEPIILGDAIAFTVYNNTITDYEVDAIFEESKRKLNINYNFHKISGCYNTNDYVLGGKILFRGYCFQILSEYHKTDLNKQKKLIKKRTS
ncbi:MAG: hypothetical protein WDA12_02895 [Bacilli bacterium]